MTIQKPTISNEIWVFDTDTLTKVLSPKRLKPHVTTESPGIDDFEYLVQHPSVQNSIRGLSHMESSRQDGMATKSHQKVVDLLNACVGHCNAAYDEIALSFGQNSDNPTHTFDLNGADNCYLSGLTFESRVGFAISQSESVSGHTDSEDGDTEGVVASMVSLKLEDQPCSESGEEGEIPMEDEESEGLVDSMESLEDNTGSDDGEAMVDGDTESDEGEVVDEDTEGDEEEETVAEDTASHIASTGSLEDHTRSDEEQVMVASIVALRRARDLGKPIGSTDGATQELEEAFKVIVQSSWPKLFTVAARGSQESFIPSLPRIFVLSIAVNISSWSLRFLIHHRSGTTASHELYLDDIADWEEICTIMLTIMLWQSPHDAGFAPFTDSRQFVLPDFLEGLWERDVMLHCNEEVRDPRDTCVMRLKRVLPGSNSDESENEYGLTVPYTDLRTMPQSPPHHIILKCSWHDSAREPDMLQACCGLFGIPTLLMSFKPCMPNGQPVSNSLFLPQATKADEPKARSLWVTAMIEEGQTFEFCDDDEDLRLCLVHCILGWLSAYQRGYMHRDISFGNLLKLMKPHSSYKFDPLGIFSSPAYPELSASSPSTNPGLHKVTQELKEILDRPDNATVMETQRAMVVDGDFAVYYPEYIRNYWTVPYPFTQSLFTSRKFAVMASSAYQHVPLDDMDSFLFTAFYATLSISKRRGPVCERERHIFSVFCRDYGGRLQAMEHLRWYPERYTHDDGYSSILINMVPRISKWWIGVENLKEQRWIESKTLVDKPNTDSEFAEWLLLEHIYAYKAVNLALECLL